MPVTLARSLEKKIGVRQLKLVLIHHIRQLRRKQRSQGDSPCYIVKTRPSNRAMPVTPTRSLEKKIGVRQLKLVLIHYLQQLCHKQPARCY